MKKARVLKSWSKRNVPEELWPEILSRLPVKSLLRFRCVSKSWQSMIDDPEFCRLHLNRFKNNFHETHLFVVQECRGYCVVKCSNTFRTTARLGKLNSGELCTNTSKASPTLKYFGSWQFVCSIDGLVMLESITRAELMLWNPSIRKVRSLPPSPAISNYMSCVDLGLGFDPLIKDYKYVRLVQIGICSPHSVAVYTVGTGLWKTIQFQGKGCSSWQWYFSFHYKKEKVCCRGSLYFIAIDLNSHASELASFDLSREVFASYSLPVDEDIDCNSNGFSEVLTLVDGGRSLAFFNFNLIQGSIWMFESFGAGTESTYWTKLYKFAMRIPKFLYLKKNGDMLLGRKQVISYNFQTNQEKLLLKRNHFWISNVHGYIESLILLK